MLGEASRQSRKMTLPELHPISPSGRVKVAITFDDILLFRGSPLPQGYDLMSNVRAFSRSLANHRVVNVYAFSNTYPAEIEPACLGVFDHWVEAGHHVANHTHHHASLNWVNAETYVADIERAAEIIEPWVARAPQRYFRYCMDMWGDTQEKLDAVKYYLDGAGYIPVPISIGFHDMHYVTPYWRTLKVGDFEGAKWIRKAYVESAVHDLRKHAANARAVFSRDPIHIWLIHGTPIAKDCLSEILDRFVEAGVEFVALEEALADPMNARIPPRISPEFLHQVEKWAIALGVPVDDRPDAILEQIERMHPDAGESSRQIFERMTEIMPERLGATVSPFPLHDCQKR
jgi:peptidoglycan/xylan/chitin deacetylase (PgdA/CDA1 family)